MKSYITVLLLQLIVLSVILAEGKPSKKDVPCLPCNCTLYEEPEYLVMDCTDRNLSIANLPDPPHNISHNISMSIYFDKNEISTLNNSILSRYKPYKIYFLSFRNNNITNITKYAFSDLQHFHGLDLSENDIDEEVLKESFQEIPHKYFTILNISSMGLRNISRDFLEPFKSCENFSLSFRNNTHNYFLVEKFETLWKRLERLDLGSSGLKNINVSQAYFPSLKSLVLDNNKFFEFPNFCFENKSNTRFPQLQNLSIQWNGMRYLDRDHYICLKSLTHFFLNGNLFAELRSNQFAMLSNLYKITLSYVGCAMNKVEPAVFNNSALKQIFFRENHIWFNRVDVSLRIFEGCPNLELLNLNDNVFHENRQKDITELLKHLTNIKVLVMGGCGLTVIPTVITDTLVNLETLALYRNVISDLGEHKFDNLTKLKKLLMGSNQLTVIPEKSLSPQFIKQATDVEFSENPFSCACDLMWFIQWMLSDKSRFKLKGNTYYNDSHMYMCSSSDHLKGRYLLGLDMSEACLLDQTEKILTLTLSILLIVFLVVGSILYRYRWHIRYFIYMVRYNHRQEVDNGHYEYDAFVAYSSEDRGWVIRTLLPVIEDKDNLKLCVHDRDFEVGNLIVDNIVDGIEKSRKVIIVLSNNFAKSDWCQFELQLIQRHVLENGQCLLVLVMLEEIETRHVTKAMCAMLQTTTYLLWGEDEHARKAFFNRLRMLLQKPSRRRKERRLSV